MKLSTIRAAPSRARQGNEVLRMSRAGRKRKNGPRHPGGQLKKQKKAFKASERTETQPHRQQLLTYLRKAGVNDGEATTFSRGEEAESPIGRLWAAGRLKQMGDSDSQAARDRYDAGNMFAQIVMTYRSAIEAPGGTSGSGMKSACAADLLCALDPDECRCFALRRRYTSAYEALAGGQRVRLELEGPEMPEPLRAAIAENNRLREDEAYVPVAADRRRVVMAVLKIAIHRQPIGVEELVYLVRGLEALRHHFGLTVRRKAKQYRNTQ